MYRLSLLHSHRFLWKKLVLVFRFILLSHKPYSRTIVVLFYSLINSLNLNFIRIVTWWTILLRLRRRGWLRRNRERERGICEFGDGGPVSGRFWLLLEGGCLMSLSNSSCFSSLLKVASISLKVFSREGCSKLLRPWLRISIFIEIIKRRKW